MIEGILVIGVAIGASMLLGSWKRTNSKLGLLVMAVVCAVCGPLGITGTVLLVAEALFVESGLFVAASVFTMVMAVAMTFICASHFAQGNG